MITISFAIIALALTTHQFLVDNTVRTLMKCGSRMDHEPRRYFELRLALTWIEANRFKPLKIGQILRIRRQIKSL